jgi:hypothetical protein
MTDIKPLLIEGATKTPEISFDNQTGVLSIKGMSYPEFGKEFYTPVLQWLDEYVQNPQSHTTVNIQFKYFNTSSAKSILALLQKLNEIRSNGHQVTVNWYYEKNDEQMIQDGENYSVLLDFPFNIKELEL